MNGTKTKKYKWKKNSYVTDEEYQVAMEKFYNGYTNYTDHFSIPRPGRYKRVVKSFNKEWAESKMVDGETYKQIEYSDHVIVTSLGRVLNTHSQKSICCLITPKKYFYHFEGKSKDIAHYIKDFNVHTIIQEFIKRDWCIRYTSRHLTERYGNFVGTPEGRW